MEKNEARMNGHPPNGSKDGFEKYFLEVHYVDMRKKCRERLPFCNSLSKILDIF